jgi:fatty-acyl-CoA synthase
VRELVEAAAQEERQARRYAERARQARERAEQAQTEYDVKWKICEGKAIIVDGFDAPALMEIIARESVGCFPMPGIASRVLATIKDAGIRPMPAGIIGSMADLVPRADLAELTTLMQAPFRNTFGSTETGPAPASKGRIAIGAMPERLSKTQSSYCQLRLVDEEGREVPEGEPGEAAENEKSEDL